MSNIIVATDLTPDSDKVIQSGLFLSKKLNKGLRVFFMDTFTPSYYGLEMTLSYSPSYVEVAEWDNYKVPEAILAKIDTSLMRMDLNKASLRVDVIPTNNFDHIQEYIDENNGDLLLIGASHKNAVERFFLGNFFEKSIFKLKTDILVVKNEINSLPKNITVGVDLDTDDDLLSLHAQNLAKQFKADVTLVNVVIHSHLEYAAKEYSDSIRDYVETRNVHAQKKLENLAKKFNDNGVHAHKVIKLAVGTKESDELEEYLENNETDLFCVEPHPSIFNGFHLGSTSLNLINHANNNFLIVKSKEVLDLNS